MPAGDPAGYLPNVIKKRLRRDGGKPYKPRSKQGRVKPRPSLPSRPPADPGTGGVRAPEPMPQNGPKATVNFPKRFRGQAQPMPRRRTPRPGQSSARRYFGRSK